MRTGSAISPSATTRSATCRARRATSPARSRATATALAFARGWPAGPRQCGLAARPLRSTTRSATCRARRATWRPRSELPRQPWHSASLPAGPRQAGWQRDLSVSYNNIGDVQSAQGDLAGALKSYRDSFGIREKLPSGTPAMRAGSATSRVSYNNVGDVQSARATWRARSELPRQPWHLRSWPSRTPAMRAGSAISRLATTRSATCRARRATWRVRSRATATALESVRSLRSKTLAMRAGRAILHGASEEWARPWVGLPGPARLQGKVRSDVGAALPGVSRGTAFAADPGRRIGVGRRRIPAHLSQVSHPWLSSRIRRSS